MEIIFTFKKFTKTKFILKIDRNKNYFFGYIGIHIIPNNMLPWVQINELYELLMI